eukprot:scaffold441256_cov34-Prasinocladus_malaysianus.AAC.1
MMLPRRPEMECVPEPQCRRPGREQVVHTTRSITSTRTVSIIVGTRVRVPVSFTMTIRGGGAGLRIWYLLSTRTGT